MSKCLLLTSFSDSNLLLKDNLGKLFSEIGINVIHPVDIDSDKPLYEGISELFEQAEFIIAEISDLNPNILFEIGHAIGMGLPIVILVDKTTDIPVSLQQDAIYYLHYDKDKGINVDHFNDIVTHLNSENLLKKGIKSVEDSMPKEHFVLDSPFQYLSAEMINPDLLENLYTIPPYFELIKSSNNIVMYGPRGCGKTTNLYMLRFSQNIGKSNVAGFYINFNHLRGAIETTDVTSNTQKMTIYFNLSFLRSLVNEIDKVKSMNKLSEGDEEEILSVIKNKTSISVNSVSELASTLSNVEHNLYKRDVNGITLPLEKDQQMISLENQLRYPSFLFNLAKDLHDNTSCFKEYNIAYLLDDYSSEWLSDNVSRGIHRCIFQRAPHCTFKIAVILGRHQTWPLDDSKYAEPTLDYMPVNMSDYLFSNKQSQSAFLREIINKRMKLSGSHLSTKDLLGIRRSRKRYEADYSGIDGLTRLFSGDLSTILYMCLRMTQNKSINESITRESQNSIIYSTSRDILTSLQSGYRWGNYVYTFVFNMMQYASMKYQYSKKNLRKDKKSRIFSGIVFKNERDLSSDAKEKLSWLLRAGVFLPYSRYTNEQRYEIKKMLFPSFRLPLIGLKDYLVVDLLNSENMLTTPEIFWSTIIKTDIDERQTQLI